MAKKEVKTDLWVFKQLEQVGIELDAQGCEIKEIADALKTASKKGTGNEGYPEYCGVVKDFVIVIEDKASTKFHIAEEDGVILVDNAKIVQDYAVNGALWYAQHITKNTTYKKVIAIGVSGNEKRHKITPVFVDDTDYYRVLPDVESFISFTEENIEEYYTKEVLQEKTNKEKDLAEILKDAADLHEDLRNYGNLKDIDKPLVVAGILLALNEKGEDLIKDLKGDDIKTDGQVIYEAIGSALKRANVQPEAKRDKIYHQFRIISDTEILNIKNETLGETPLKYYTKFLHKKLFKSIKYTNSAEDYLGRFYGEFMSYSGGDGQTLGIVLTPKHITELFCDLIDLQPTDVVLDPCCGTAGFLIAAMHSMLSKAETDAQKLNIKKKQLHGIELQSYMFTIATTNMILRGDGKSNIINSNFFDESANKLQLKGATVGMINPPYSQGSKKNPQLYEISFIEHLLDSLAPDARCVAIVPQSTFTGKTSDELGYKENILKHHTLEGVITLNKDTFYGVGVHPCIAIFTAHQKHPKDHVCKFINFKDDGWQVSPQIGLLETKRAKDRKQHLLDVWFDKIEADTDFCVKTTIEASDEWLHSFYYFNDNIPTEESFDKTVADFCAFEFTMIMQGKKYLFAESDKKKAEHSFQSEEAVSLTDREWKEFYISGEKGIFNIEATKSGIDKNKLLLSGEKLIPYITRSDAINGINLFIPSVQNKKYSINEGNCITIGLDTQTVFYQPHKFYTGQNIQIVNYEGMNKYSALFVISMLKVQMEKFNWGGNGATLGRLSKTKIMLPVNESGKPDYDFMEQYIRGLMAAKYSSYLDFLNI